MPLVRVGRGRRGARRLRAREAGRLTAPASPGGADGLLRAALEAALVVAREGEEETPAIPAPVPLRPFLRFAKLPPRALAVARKALEADDEFRARVAESTEEPDVGRAGWLFLSRPEGWETELAALLAEAEESAREHADRRAEHDARRRLAAVQEAARRAEENAAAARAEATEAVNALAEERRARQVAVESAGAAARRLEQVADERDRARAAAAAAKAEVEALRRRVAELEAARRTPPPPAPPVPPAAPSVPPPAPSPVEAAAPALAAAADAAARLAETLRSAVTALGGELPAGPPGGGPAAAPPGAGAPADAPAAERSPATERAPERSRRGRPVAGPVRHPVPLPPAVFDDSVEAAEHLVRVPGIIAVIDGYNVSQAGWPDQPIAEQRRRLVDALAELAARTGVDPRVVFDGSEIQLPPAVGTTAKAVKVSFSPPGVEADDVVIEMVNRLPANRPVVVASSDRRVQQGAARAGANVMSSEQLLGVLR